MEFRTDNYAIYYDIECRFWKISDEKYCLQSKLDINLLDKGFHLYNEEELKNKMYTEVYKSQIQSAYHVNTFCLYKGGNYEIGNVFNGNVILFPNLDTKRQLGFHIYDDRTIDVNYNEFMQDAEKIWEERKSIEGFVFDVEPIVYLKKKE